MDAIIELLSTKNNLLWTVIVSAAVSAVITTSITYFFRKKETRFKLAAEHEYEQRKKLRDLISNYHGRLLHAANTLNYRFWNLYSNHNKNWLDVKGEWAPEQYYFVSSVYRFLNVCALARKFEREAIYIDARIAEKRDFLIIKYIEALRWCMTDVSLFDGLNYNSSVQSDHFFSDKFRQYCDAFLEPDGGIIQFENFQDQVQLNSVFNPIFNFFDSLSPNEKRFRWDRLVIFHLLLVSFINTIGYSEHKTSKDQIIEIVKNIQNKVILENLVEWLPKHGIRGKQVRHIKRALKSLK